MKSERTQGERSLIWTPSATPAGQKEASHPGWQECHVPLANKRTLSDISAYTHNIIFRTSFRILIGFAPIFPDICYHLTHYKPAAADIPVASDNPTHYADAIRYNARMPL